MMAVVEHYLNKTTLSNGTYNDSSSEKEFLDSRIPSILITIFLTIITLATVIGNALVIVAILTERSLQRVQYYLIMSLAMADEMVGILVSPLAIYYNVNQRWKIGLFMCDLWIFLDVLACSASILHLVAIALDRYWSVIDVTYIHRRTKVRIFTMIAIVWGVALLISIPPFFGWKDEHFAERVNRYEVCLYSQDLIYQIISTVLSFYAPLLLILLLYWRIYVVARDRIRRERQRKSYTNTTESQYTWQSQSIVAETITKPDCLSAVSLAQHEVKEAKAVDGGVGNKRWLNAYRKASSTIHTLAMHTSDRAKGENGQRSRSSTMMKAAAKILPKREARAARTLAIVTGSFILFWLPFFVLALYRPIACSSQFLVNDPAGDNYPHASYCNIPPLVDSIFLWLGYINSALNPVIYTVFSPDFAKAIKRILSKAMLRF